MTWTTWFSAGRLMALAFLIASCTSSSLISRSADTTGCTPRLLNPRRCPPLTPRYTLRTSTSAICSASTMAFRMSSLASAASTISALRTPRERAWPTPMMLSPDESELTSPTTAQIFDVPTSRPTMTGDWSNMFLFDGLEGFGCGRERGAGFQPKHRRVVGDGQIECPDDLADFFAVIVNQPPVAQLVLDPV